MQVVAVVCKRTNELVHPLDQLRQLLARQRHVFQDHQRVPYAVPLRNVTRDRQPARLLTADQDLFTSHNFRDILETDLRNLKVQTVVPRQILHLVSHGKSHDHLALHFLVLAQITQQQKQNAVRIDKVSVFVVHANPVRIAVVGNAQHQCGIAGDYLRKLP